MEIWVHAILIGSHALVYVVAHQFISQGDISPFAKKIYNFSTSIGINILLLIAVQSLLFRNDLKSININWLQVDLLALIFLAALYLPWLIISKAIHIAEGEHESPPAARADRRTDVTELIRTVCASGHWRVGIPFFFIWTLIMIEAGRLVGVPATKATLSAILARVCSLGVFIGSVLSGYGSVSFPVENLKVLFVSVSADQLKSCERQLVSVLKERQRRRNVIEELRQIYDLSAPSTPENDRLLQHQATFALGDHTLDDEEADLFPEDRHQPGWRSAGVSRRNMDRQRAHREVARLTRETASLENVALDLAYRFEDLRRSRNRYLRSLTPKGKLLNSAAWVMVAACIYKVIAALTNVTFRRPPGTDPATMAAEILLRMTQVQIDAQIVAAYFALVFAGCIVYSTVTGFSAKVVKILTTTRSKWKQADLILLVLCEAQCLYFAACALLLRAYLPQQSRESIEAVLGADLDFGEFHLQNDWVFAVSCFASTVVAIVQQAARRKLRSVI